MTASMAFCMLSNSARCPAATVAGSSTRQGQGRVLAGVDVRGESRGGHIEVEGDGRQPGADSGLDLAAVHDRVPVGGADELVIGTGPDHRACGDELVAELDVLLRHARAGPIEGGESEVDAAVAVEAVVPNGVQTTAVVDSVTVSIPETVNVTGSGAVGAVGSANASGKATALPGSVQATGVVDSANASGKAVVSPSGVASTGAVGSVNILTAIVVSASGVQATGQVGSVVASIPQAFAVSGVSGTAAVGSVSIAIPVTVSPSGVISTAAPGSVTVTGTGLVSLVGIQAVASGGTVSVVIRAATSTPVERTFTTGADGDFATGTGGRVFYTTARGNRYVA